MPPWVPVASIGAAAILLVVAVIVMGNALRGGDGEVPEHTVSAEGRTLGSPDAPVTMVDYLDFQCPFCGDFVREVQPEIEEKYIDPGLVMLEVRPIAFLGPESVWAGEAAACANEQGRFMDYHDKLFEEQGRENSGAFAIDNLKAFAVDLGLDSEPFNSCLDSHKYMEQLRRETEQARDAGINSTPTFYIGDKKLTGLKSFEEMSAAIEKELEEAS